jgi:hypothetical protein
LLGIFNQLGLSLVQSSLRPRVFWFSVVRIFFFFSCRAE